MAEFLCAPHMPAVDWIVDGRVHVLLPGVLQRAHERNQITLVRLPEIQFKHKIEELDRVFERKQPSVVKIGWRILDASESECFDQALRTSRIESLDLEIVSGVVGVVGRRMAGRTVPCEDLLAS